jgi:hypothetical protein
LRFVQIFGQKRESFPTFDEKMVRFLDKSSILKITVIRSVHLVSQKEAHLAIFGLFGFQSSEPTFKISER